MIPFISHELREQYGIKPGGPLPSWGEVVSAIWRRSKRTSLQVASALNLDQGFTHRLLHGKRLPPEEAQRVLEVARAVRATENEYMLMLILAAWERAAPTGRLLIIQAVNPPAAHAHGLLVRARRLAEQEAHLAAAITHHAPLPPEAQAKFDQTETEAEALLVAIDTYLAGHPDPAHQPLETTLCTSVPPAVTTSESVSDGIPSVASSAVSPGY
jgi:hypothetical protein